MKDYAKIDTSDKKPSHKTILEGIIFVGIILTGFALFAWAVA